MDVALMTGGLLVSMSIDDCDIDDSTLRKRFGSENDFNGRILDCIVNTASLGGELIALLSMFVDMCPF